MQFNCDFDMNLHRMYITMQYISGNMRINIINYAACSDHSVDINKQHVDQNIDILKIIIERLSIYDEK